MKPRTTTDQPIAPDTVARWRAAAVAIAPLVLLAGFVYHPFLPFLTNPHAAAEAGSADTVRWGIAHLLVGVGSGFMILAFLGIRSVLREAGEDRWSIRALPFIVVGSALYAILPGMEFTVIAVAETGGDVAAAQMAIEHWFVPVIMTSALTYAIGVFGFAVGISRSEVFGRGKARVVVIALVFMALARFVPLGLVQFYVQGAAGLVAFWIAAYEMRLAAVSHGLGRTLPAT
jgi:hypothetical protein